jgi:hypothetical protein
MGIASAHCSSTLTPFVKIQTIEPGKAVLEVGKYHCKLPGIRAEKWLAGHKLPVMNPELAARWELATYSQRLRERYGSLREIPLDESVRHGDAILLSAAELAEADSQKCCAACGVVAPGYRWAVWPDSLAGWVGYCWARGSPALAMPLARADLEGSTDPSVHAKVGEVDGERLRKSLKRGRNRAWFAGRIGA